MASTFDLIGAQVKDEADLERIANDPAFEPGIVDLGGAQYLVARDGAGAEIWFGLDAEGLVNANPFFAIGRPVLAKIDALAAPDPRLGSREATVDISILDGENLAAEACVLGVNLPETAASTTATGAFDLCVFSHETLLVDNEEDFAALKRQIALTPKSFLPTGKFTAEGSPHRPLGLGAGSVVRAGAAPGAFGGPGWHWAEVATQGGTIGVVWSPADCGPAQAGQILLFDGVVAAKAFSPFWQAQ